MAAVGVSSDIYKPDAEMEKLLVRFHRLMNPDEAEKEPREDAEKAVPVATTMHHLDV